MRRIFITMILAAVTLMASARQPERGYRGFAEWNNSITSYEFYYWTGEKSETCYFSGISTSHGFQFNPNFFLGAGLSIEHSRKYNGYILPVFIQARTDQKFGKYTPFGDLRAGFSLTDGGGPYLSPSVGYRFNWGRKCGVNISAGLTLKWSHVDEYDIAQTPDGEGWYVTDVKTRFDSKAFFSFRIGIDF